MSTPAEPRTNSPSQQTRDDNQEEIKSQKKQLSNSTIKQVMSGNKQSARAEKEPENLTEENAASSEDKSDPPELESNSKADDTKPTEQNERSQTETSIPQPNEPDEKQLSKTMSGQVSEQKEQSNKAFASTTKDHKAGKHSTSSDQGDKKERRSKSPEPMHTGSGIIKIIRYEIILLRVGQVSQINIMF